MAKIYEIIDDLREFIEAYEGLEDEQAYKDTLEALQGELDDKVEAWCKAEKNLEGERDAVKAELDRLQLKYKMLDNHVERMKQTLQMYMVAAGRRQAGRTLGAKIVKNGGLAPLEITVQPKDLPEQFQKVTIEADKKAIRDALDKGEELPFAQLLERGEHLKIG
jgi:hypothetical protein